MIRTFVFMLFVVVAIGSTEALGQNAYLMNMIQLVDRTTSNYLTLEQSSDASSQVNIIFPTRAGAVNEALYVTTIQNGIVTLDWTSVSDANSMSNSARLAANQVTTNVNTPTEGINVAVFANRAYRFSGIFRAGRSTAVGGSDNFRVRITVPTNSTYMSLAVRATCRTDATGVPNFAAATSGTTVTSGDINPAGGTDDTPNLRCYYFEGIVVTGSSTGNITFQVVGESAGTTTNQLTLGANANLTVQEIR